MNPSHSILFSPDLLGLIAKHLPWSDLSSFLFLPSPAPFVIKVELRRRIAHHLVPFLALHHQRAFFDVLQRTGAVITGSFIRSVLLQGNEPPRAFKGPVANVNIVVRQYRQNPIADLLKRVGYQRMECAIDHHFYPAACGYSKFFKYDEGADEECQMVTVTVARSSVIEVLLASPSTADSTFLTGTELVSLHPRMMVANECMIHCAAGVAQPTRTTLERQGAIVLASNSHWRRACDGFCPMRWRKTIGETAIARFTWREADFIPRPDVTQPPTHDPLVDEDEQPGSRRGNTDPADLMNQANLRWRVWKECNNPHCSNSRLLEQRKEIVQP